MFTPTDREFRDDIFRKKERLKIKRSLCRPFVREKSLDIEEPIAIENDHLLNSHGVKSKNQL